MLADRMTTVEDQLSVRSVGSNATASSAAPKNSKPSSQHSEGSSSVRSRTKTTRVAPELHKMDTVALGHDFDGGGIGVRNGQLAQVCRGSRGWCVRVCGTVCVDLTRHYSARQAQDRDFEACFERCRRAVRNIIDANPAHAAAAHTELQDLGAAKD